MAYGVIHRFPGGTQAQYEAALAVVHPDGGRGLPPGQIFHVAGPSDHGWTVVAIHDSRESWEHFRDGTLMPALSQGIEGGPTVPPEETTFEVANQVTAERTWFAAQPPRERRQGSAAAGGRQRA
jgi:hypothetical protein